MIQFIVRSVIFIFFILLSLCSRGQDELPIPSRDSLEQLLAHNDYNLTLGIINSNLRKNLTPFQINLLKTYKIRPLIEAHLYDDAFILSLELLSKETLDTDLRIGALLNRALIYEIKDDFKNSKADLDTLESLFNRNPLLKNEDYGEYLYRKASLYRVNDSTNTAKNFAEQSVAFSEENNYKVAAGVAYAVLGFLTFDDDLELTNSYYQKSLDTYIRIGDKTGEAMMYANLSDLELSRNDITAALKYTDTMMMVSRDLKNSVPLYIMYEERSSLFERMGNVDSAYVNFKKYHEYFNEYKNNQKEVAFQELSFQNDIEKIEQAKRKVVEDNLRISRANTKLTYFLIGSLMVLVLIFILYRKLILRSRIIKTKSRNNSILIKELHHRVKNNLMLTLSLIEFQKDDFNDDLHKSKMTDLQHRIEAVAIVHQQMMGKNNEDLDDSHNIKQYFIQIAESLFNLYPDSIDFNHTIEELNVPLDMAVPLGILINELLSNTLKHAQPENRLIISLNVYENTDQLVIEYKDNGINSKDRISDGLGSFILQSMILQLKGEVIEKDFDYHIILNQYK